MYRHQMRKLGGWYKDVGLTDMAKLEGRYDLVLCVY